MLGEWVIDIIKEWVLSLGFLTTSSIDRGDPAANDFNQGDITQDNAWHDLDLSAIIPAGAKFVLLRVFVLNTGIGKLLTFREKGNINEVNTSFLLTQVAFNGIGQDIHIALDPGRKVQYKAAVGGWLVIGIAVGAWWF